MVEQPQAIKEFHTLIHDLDDVGLQTEVRHGDGASLLVFVQAPRDLVGNWIYKSRYILSTISLKYFQC